MQTVYESEDSHNATDLNSKKLYTPPVLFRIDNDASVVQGGVGLGPDASGTLS